MQNKFPIQDIQNATCIIHVIPAEKVLLSGFLFSKKGYILTAAHSFHENKVDDIDKIFDVEFTTTSIKTTAKLLEIGPVLDKQCDPPIFVDYAILEIIEIEKIAHIKELQIHRGWRCWEGQEFLLCGYKESLGNKMVIERGTEYIRDINSSENTHLHLGIDSVLMMGLSGGPVVVYNKKKRNCLVVAIQSLQSEDEPRYDYALPISEIASFSQIIKDYFKEIVINRIKWLSLDHKLVKFRISENNERSFMLIHPDPNVNQAAYNEFEITLLKRNQLAYDVKAFLDKQEWIPKKQYIMECIFYVGRANNQITPPTEYISNYYVDPNKLRGIVDYSNTIDYNTNKPCDYPEHLSLINSWDGELKIYVDRFFDFKINVPIQNNNNSGVYNILLDMLIDCHIAESIPLLHHFFINKDTRVSLCKAKVNYAKSKRLKMYGKDIPVNCTYVPFSSCSRFSLNHSIDLSLYRKIWQDFIVSYIFESISDRKTISTPNITSEQIVSFIKKYAKKYDGQLSFGRIKKQIDKLPKHEEHLYALVILKRRIQNEKSKKGKKIRAILKSIYRDKKYSANATVIANEESLQCLFKYMPYFNFYFFRYGLNEKPKE